VALGERCRACHPPGQASVRPAVFPPARIRFAHADHAAAQCTTCHSRVAVRGLATSDDLPQMATCLGCHDGRRADRRCATCHLSDPDGVLRTELGDARLVPTRALPHLFHGEDWTASHALAARDRARQCAACHRDHECLACHDGSVRPRDVHPADWLAAHPLEARAGELRCQGCHRGQSFCRTCHQRAGVAQGGPAARTGTASPGVHRDPSWVGSPPSRHGREARRALETCVSCHAGRDCVACHSAVIPHPPGWTDRCHALVAAGSTACVACHDRPEGLCE